MLTPTRNPADDQGQAKMSDRIRRFIDDQAPDTPCLIVDLDMVEQGYESLRRALPEATVFYAMKANPAPVLISRLADLGSNFDAASAGEVEQCLDLGIDPGRISFGSTVKKTRDIAHAHEAGIRLFAFDSEAELYKLATEAPGARVFCRFLMEGDGADWPLSKKFGCDLDMAGDLLLRASDLGLEPYGVSFHVGSQQRDIDQWGSRPGSSPRRSSPRWRTPASS